MEPKEIDTRMAKFLAPNFLAARIHRGVSVEELAARVDLSVEIVQKFEAGEGKCVMCFLTKVACALDIPQEYFLHRDPIFPKRPVDPMKGLEEEFFVDTKKDYSTAFRIGVWISLIFIAITLTIVAYFIFK